MSRVTVRKYLRNGGVVKYNLTDKRVFQGALRGHEDWLHEKFFQHGGNADVIRQELESEKGIAVSLRMWSVQCRRIVRFYAGRL